MRRLARELLAGEEAWVVGGAVRDELLGRPLLDLDIVVRDPEHAARRYGRRAEGAPFPLSERHGAWRVALAGGETVDFTPLRARIEDDLATRDFTVNAIAVPLAGGEPIDPFSGREDLAARRLRAVSPTIFRDDPLRLLRAVRLEDELGFRLDEETERLARLGALLVTAPAGERILAELERLTADGLRRLDELGLLTPLGGSLERLRLPPEIDSAPFRLVSVFGPALERLPVPAELRRYAAVLRRAQRPPDASPRSIHRFRLATEPWALDALAYLGASEHAAAVAAARERDPGGPLLRGDELGVAPGPEVGRLLAAIEEERAAGTIATRGEALRFVTARAHAPSPVQARFAATAPGVAELERRRRQALHERVRRFVDPQGDERALDVGAGTGALAFALAPLVREVIALDLVPELLAEGRREAARFPNVTFVEGDATRLSYEVGSFDLAGCIRTLHHVASPELLVAELARVTRPAGRIVVVDQLGLADPLATAEHDRFERARDPSHARALPDEELRALFRANGLVLLRAERELELRELEPYLALAGCSGKAREQAQALAPGASFTAEYGWYLLRRNP